MDLNLEKRIASVENKYRLMADRFIDAVWVLDASTMKYLFISPDVYNLRGFSQEELIGKDIREMFPADSSEIISSVIEEGRKNWDAGIEKTYTIEVEVLHKNGSTVWTEISAKFVKDKDEDLKIVGISRDIDKRKKAEKQQEEAYKELQKTLKEKEELLKKVKKLESLLPICCGCRRIRDDNNKWWPLEKYVESKADSKFTHTFCPDCKEIYYPES